MTMLRTTTLLATAFATAALLLSIGATAAQARVKVGVLECRGGTTSFVLASVTDLRCAFRPSARGERYRYRATIRRVGPDISFRQTTVLAWAVFAPTRKIGRGDLRGTYVGVGAGASLGLGLGANALLGGSNNTIALQPLSVQGHTGLGIGAGVESLVLR